MADERWKECKHHYDGCACREHAWAEQVARLTAELAAAQTARQDLFGSTYCVSCGAKFEEDKPDTKGRVIAHVMTCSKHPMRVIEAQRDAALTAVTQLKSELDVEKSNYECLKGEWNRAVALAQEHCPKPVLGQAWLTDGIPLLAERAKRAESKTEEQKGLLLESAKTIKELADLVSTANEMIPRLEEDVERLKAQPTAEQERKWVLRYLSDRACHLKITDSYEGSRALERAERAIEQGDHWPEGEKT
jgi:hypothetical protein